MNMPDRKMYKLVCPMERNGRKWWMNVGAGFTNRDGSVNLYLDAIPVNQSTFHLQLREYTEEEMRQNAERRASFNGNRGGYNNHASARHAPANDVGTDAKSAPGGEIDFRAGSESQTPQSLPF